MPDITQPMIRDSTTPPTRSAICMKRTRTRETWSVMAIMTAAKNTKQTQKARKSKNAVKVCRLSYFRKSA